MRTEHAVLQGNQMTAIELKIFSSQLREAKKRERERMSEEKREKQKQAARSRMSERRAAMTIEEK